MHSALPRHSGLSPVLFLSEFTGACLPAPYIFPCNLINISGVLKTLCPQNLEFKLLLLPFDSRGILRFELGEFFRRDVKAATWV